MKLPHRQFLHLAVAAAAVSLMVFTPSGAALSAWR
jgi:hypothetical protein